MKSFVFSIEALLALAAAAALAGHAVVDAGQWHGELRAYQLVQDLLEISLKNPENAAALAEFYESGKSDFLEKKYSALMAHLGSYCLELRAEGKALKVNCETGKGEAPIVSGERILFTGNKFVAIGISLSPA